MSTTPAAKTLNKIDFLRLMMLSREGDRREGILLRQSKGWFQVGGLGHEALAADASSHEAASREARTLTTDVVIIGAGITGAFLAERLTRMGRRVVIVELEPPGLAPVRARSGLAAG